MNGLEEYRKILINELIAMGFAKTPQETMGTWVSRQDPDPSGLVEIFIPDGNPLGSIRVFFNQDEVYQVSMQYFAQKGRYAFELFLHAFASCQKKKGWIQDNLRKVSLDFSCRNLSNLIRETAILEDGKDMTEFLGQRTFDFGE